MMAKFLLTYFGSGEEGKQMQKARLRPETAFCPSSRPAKGGDST